MYVIIHIIGLKSSFLLEVFYLFNLSYFFPSSRAFMDLTLWFLFTSSIDFLLFKPFTL